MGKPYHDKETLERLYCEQDLTQSEIAERYDVTQALISRWLRKTGVVESEDKPWHDEETLRRLYHEEGLDQSEIADKFGIAPNTVSEWMSKHDITTRPHQDAPHKNEDVLRYLYHEERLSMREIGERLDRSTETIRHWLDKHDIKRRDPNTDRHIIPEDELREMYIERQMSTTDCAEVFGCSPKTISERLDRYGIKVRDNAESHRVYWGEYVPYSVDPLGYPRWHDQIAGEEIYVHQLLAISEGAPPEKVFREGFIIHHRNTVRWDNRPQNLELLREDTHMATHRNGEWIEQSGYPELQTVPPEGVRE